MSSLKENIKNNTKEETVTVHPLTVLIDAVSLAQKRGAYTLDEASLIAKAVNYYKKEIESNKKNRINNEDL